jgi:hypothetical protein
MNLMKMNAFAVLSFIVSVTCHAQEVTTAGNLGSACLVTCQAANGQGTLMEELGETDRCVAYLKAVAGGVEWFNSINSSGIETGSCTKKILANRTATRPQEDEVLAQACALGKWISDRPGVSGRPAVQVAVGWMKVTRCE